MQPTREFLRRVLAGGVGQSSGAAITQATANLGPGANNGVAIDATGWPSSASILVLRGTKTGGVTSITVKVQESVNGVSGFTDALANQSISANNTAFRFSFPRTKKFLRSVITVGGGGGDTATVSAVLEAIGTPALSPDWTQLGLYTAVIDRGLDTTLADLTLPTGGPGALSLIQPWGSPINLPDGSVISRNATAAFASGGPSDDTTAAGWFLVTADAVPTLLGFMPFDSPKPIVSGGPVLNVAPEMIASVTAPYARARYFNG